MTALVRASPVKSRAIEAIGARTKAGRRRVDGRALVEWLAGLDSVHHLTTIRQLSNAERRTLDDEWRLWAHAGQVLADDDWNVWLIRAARGFGKTRAGAEWAHAYARDNKDARIALVGGTADDVRQVMVEGPSGLIATCLHGENWTWRRDMGEFTFASGAMAFTYSAETPDRLRGLEHHAAWCDELARWWYADTARTLAADLVVRAGAARVRRTVTTGLAGLAVRPGAVVGIGGEEGTWRVEETVWEAMAVRFVLAPVVPGSLPVRGASGRVAAAADERVGATLLRLVDLPGADETLSSSPRLGIVAAGEGSGWRGAPLLWSVDDGASWREAGETAAPGIVGTVEIAPAPAPPTLVDRAGVLVVRLARPDMSLGDADPGALDRGVNLAAAGGELIQFGRAEPLGDGRWRLTELLRGRRATGARDVAAGDGFALLDAGSVRVVELPLAALGGTVRVMASGVGDERAVEARTTVEGLAVRPPSPVQLHAEPATDGVVLRWTRRSRAGWRWVDGIDAPLGEEAERYRVTLSARDGSVREVECVAPVLTVAAASWADIVRVDVRQRGTWAESRPATIERGETE